MSRDRDTGKNDQEERGGQRLIHTDSGRGAETHTDTYGQERIGERQRKELTDIESAYTTETQTLAYCTVLL